MAQNKKKLLKYSITNESTNELILERGTKKATLEWIDDMLSTLSDKDHLTLAKFIHGEKITDWNLHSAVIKAANEATLSERLKVLLNKSIPLGSNTYIITASE